MIIHSAEKLSWNPFVFECILDASRPVGVRIMRTRCMIDCDLMKDNDASIDVIWEMRLRTVR